MGILTVEPQPQFPALDLTRNNADYFIASSRAGMSLLGRQALAEQTTPADTRIVFQELVEAGQATGNLGAQANCPQMWEAWRSGFNDFDGIRTTVNGKLLSVTDGALAVQPLIAHDDSPFTALDHVDRAVTFSSILPVTYNAIVGMSPAEMSLPEIRFRTWGAYLNYLMSLNTAQISSF